MIKNSFFYLLMLLFISCSKQSDTASNNGSTGQGGSLARFAISGNSLYVVDHYSLKTFDISQPGVLTLKYTTPINSAGVETIYPYKDKLFIGSRDGMFIYNTFPHSEPALAGTARHTRSCDPVVANDTTAFVTLRGNQPCGPANDGLYIYKITNLLAPQLLTTYVMPTPHGLGLKDTVLYVCQKENGMSIFDVSNPSNPLLRRSLTNRSFQDVICYDDMLICYVSNGLVLYDISAPFNPLEIKEIIN